MKTLKFVAQQAMDRFYQTYKSDTDFFSLDDFVDYCGNAVSDFYKSLWQLKYTELRQERKDEVVSFDSGILAEQEISISDDLFAKTIFSVPLTYPIMTFEYDQNNCGAQAVFYNSEDGDGFEKRAIRSTLLQKRSLSGMPICDRVFFLLNGVNIEIVNKRMLPVKRIKIYYVPSVNEDMIVPDGIVQKVLDTVIMSLKESKKGVVVKRELDNNPNMVIEGELDKSQLKN